jgi:thiol-disulfide isomerase/thioredoxin
MAVIVAIAALSALTVLVVAASLSDDGEQALDVGEVLGDLDVTAPVPDGAEVARIGAPAPDVQLAYLDGGVQRMSDLQGRPLVLNFWASTCAPCLEEMPAFQSVAERTEGEVTFVGIGVADTESASREMVARTGVRYRNARDPRSEIFGIFGGTALPRTVLVDADGTVVATHSGALDRASLTDLLREQGWI